MGKILFVILFTLTTVVGHTALPIEQSIKLMPIKDKVTLLYTLVKTTTEKLDLPLSEKGMALYPFYRETYTNNGIVYTQVISPHFWKLVQDDAMYMCMELENYNKNGIYSYAIDWWHILNLVEMSTAEVSKEYMWQFCAFVVPYMDKFVLSIFDKANTILNDMFTRQIMAITAGKGSILNSLYSPDDYTEEQKATYDKEVQDALKAYFDNN